MIDFKIVEERSDGENITYQRVRFYEGDITTENEYVFESRSIEPVTRYRRSALIEERECWYE
jgi:hypothetical protein